MTCSRPQRNVHRPGFEPGTPWSEIQGPNHCATPPPTFFLRLYVQSKQLRSCQDGLLKPHCSWASFPVAAYQYTVSILLPVTGNMLFLNQRKREYFSIKTCAGCEATYFCNYRQSYRVQCMTLCSLWTPNYLAVHVYLTFLM